MIGCVCLLPFVCFAFGNSLKYPLRQRTLLYVPEVSVKSTYQHVASDKSYKNPIKVIKLAQSTSKLYFF